MAKRCLVILALLLAACAASPERGGGGNGHTVKTPITDEAPPRPVDTPAGSPRWLHQRNLDRAVQFLLESQKKDGGWGHFLPKRPWDIYIGGVNSLLAFGNASSSLCCMALLMQPRTEAIDAALLRGYQHLVDAPDTARINGGTFYDVWAHAYMLAALGRGLRDERLKPLEQGIRGRIGLELRRLFHLQALDGGWGYFDFEYQSYRPSGDLSTTFTTAAALAGLCELREAGVELPRRDVDLALNYLERMRISNGAYFYSSGHQYYPHGGVNKIRGSLGRSQSGDYALICWGRKLQATDIKDAMDRFFKHHVFIEMGRSRQFPHEAWYAVAPYYYYFGHYYASRNLAHLPEPNRKDYAARLAGLIAATQYDDGSFWDYPLFGYTKAYGTGFGVLILSYCKAQFE